MTIIEAIKTAVAKRKEASDTHSPIPASLQSEMESFAITLLMYSLDRKWSPEEKADLKVRLQHMIGLL